MREIINQLANIKMPLLKKENYFPKNMESLSTALMYYFDLPTLND